MGWLSRLFRGSSDDPVADNRGASDQPFKPTAPLKAVPGFPPRPLDLFRRGDAIGGQNLANVAQVGLCICDEFRAWKKRAPGSEWASYGDRELAALESSYRRMSAAAKTSHRIDTKLVRKYARGYIECIRNDPSIMRQHLDAQFTLYACTIDFGNTIGCGGTLSTILESYG